MTYFTPIAQMVQNLWYVLMPLPDQLFDGPSITECFWISTGKMNLSEILSFFSDYTVLCWHQHVHVGGIAGLLGTQLATSYWQSQKTGLLLTF